MTEITTVRLELLKMDMTTPQFELFKALFKLDSMRKSIMRFFNLETTQLDILLCVLKEMLNDRRLSISDIYLLLEIPAATALRHFSRLVATNVLIRERDSNDRRRNYVSISEDFLKKLIEHILCLESCTLMTDKQVNG